MSANQNPSAAQPSFTLQQLREHKSLFDELIDVVYDQLSDESQRQVRQTQDEFEQVLGELNEDQVELMQLRALARTWGEINSSLDLEDVLNNAMDQVIALTGAERGYILLKRQDSDELEFRIARSVETDPNDTTFQISRTIVNQVIETGAPMLTDNAATDSRVDKAQSVVNFALRSVLCVPLTRKDEVLGAVYVANRLRVGLFTQREIDLLTAFANQAAIAIQNARSFTAVKTNLQKANAEVERLKIVINESKMRQEVSEITETDYFRYLQDMARQLRSSSGKAADDDDNAL